MSASTKPSCLVVVRAGNSSLHEGYLEGARTGAYDLVVSYFGDDPDRFRRPEENRVDRKGGKWDGILDLFRIRPELLDRYEYFWFPDDDIQAATTDVVALFEAMRHDRLSVGQPSLSPDSYFSWIALLNLPSFRLRYVNAIEVMMPCLGRDALKQALPLFAQSSSGWGIDFIWTRMEPDNRYKAAILDTVVMRHTRPVGGAIHTMLKAKGVSPAAEEQALLARHGLEKPTFHVYAGRLADGRRIDERSLSGRIELVLTAFRDLHRHRHVTVETEHWARRMRRSLRHHIFASVDLSQTTVVAR